VSYSVWSFDDTMNEHSELSPIFCQVHHSWQLCLSPISDIIHTMLLCNNRLHLRTLVS